MLTSRQIYLLQRIVNHEIMHLKDRVRDSSWQEVWAEWNAKLQEYLQLQETLNHMETET